MKSLLNKGCKVLAVNRSTEKAIKAIDNLKLDPNLVSKVEHVEIDLSDLQSVREGINQLLVRPDFSLDSIICNAAVYNPWLRKPLRSKQGYELSMATNHLGHFLIIQLLLESLMKTNNNLEVDSANYFSPRIVILGTVTANFLELGGKIPIPSPADIGDLSGFENGFLDPISMANGKRFKPGKAYKDSKLCNMITAQELHKRYQDKKIVSMSLYPGCVAETKLFRTTPFLFRWLFPLFQRFITGGYVSQRLAGERVAEVATAIDFEYSGVHWSWGNRQKKNRRAFSQKLSQRITNQEMSERMWDLSMKLVGLK
tara:strand:+ start:97 stop:1035 length:939 start_codon:yes stop_codon:yes gene_type:complete